MRILDDVKDRRLDKVTMYLKKGEAEDLMEAISALLSKQSSNHEQPSESTRLKELTICLDQDTTLEDSKYTP